MVKKYALFNESFFKNKPWWIPGKLHNVVCLRANPRSKEYMIQLLNNIFPDAQLIEDIPKDINGQLILLYPDAIGLGCGRIEKIVNGRFKDVIVLNGRKRSFILNTQTRFKLLLKRFLEVTFLPELIASPFLIVLCVVLCIKDKLAGRT